MQGKMECGGREGGVTESRKHYGLVAGNRGENQS